MFGSFWSSVATSVAPQVRSKKGYENFIVTNPPRRQEIRPDFPNAFDLYVETNMISFFEFINKEVKKSPIETIYIAYPHKHPKKFSDPHVANVNHLQKVQMILEKKLPQINWRIADSIVDTIQLDRSGNQNSVHALTGKQVYELYENQPFHSSKEPHNPFVSSNGECSNPYFIVFDHKIEQGTTMASMISFLEHNGGKVLAVGSYEREALVQENTRPNYPHIHLSAEFSDPSRNTGRLNQLASLFLSSVDGAYEEYNTPQKCMEAFEEALNGIGHSVFALTNGECKRLSKNIREDVIYFPDLIMELRNS